MTTVNLRLRERPGSLDRLVATCRRRGFGLQSMSWGAAPQEGERKITLRFDPEASLASRIIANLERIVDVLEVEDLTDAPRVERNLAFIRVGATMTHQAELWRDIKPHGARLVEMGLDEALVEMCGTDEAVDALIADLARWGIHEIVRTGTIAVARPKVARSKVARLSAAVA